MRRRTRIDLGQQPAGPKEGARLDRKKSRWAERNPDQPLESNPFLTAIRPTDANYGDSDETYAVLKQRLDNMEFGNFPGYFKYRNKDAPTTASQAGDKGAPGEEADQPPVAKQPAGEPAEALGPEEEQKEPAADERLTHFERSWFEGRRVLDIGCNRGQITYAIARNFAPDFILGIDIDLKLINMANKDLHLQLERSLIEPAREQRVKRALELAADGAGEGPAAELAAESHHYPLASYVAQGPLALIEDLGARDVPTGAPAALEADTSHEAGGPGSDRAASDWASAAATTTTATATTTTQTASWRRFPNNVMFVEHNYVLARDELLARQKEQFDTLLCLSVTKWVHLNYRDAGLKRFFQRAYRHLRPGGLLVLEAQPFDNYARRKKLANRLRQNFYSIQLRPEQFDEYLLGAEVGFRRIIYQSQTEHECAGFQRPLKVFLK